jgi:hypothetical protein
MQISATAVGTTMALCALTSAHTVRAQPLAAVVTTPSPRHAPALRVTAGVLLGAAVAHAANAPDVWERTARGAAYRVGDQAGYLAARSAVHFGISRAISWRGSNAACAGAIVARARCGIAQTLVVQTEDGAPRPDIARLGGLIAASFTSLVWRPERARRSDASAFVLTRVGSGLAVAALRRAVSGRRATARPVATDP